MVNFNPIDKDYIVSWQSDLENRKESILPVCDTLSQDQRKYAAWGGTWKNVEQSIVYVQLENSTMLRIAGKFIFTQHVYIHLYDFAANIEFYYKCTFK